MWLDGIFDWKLEINSWGKSPDCIKCCSAATPCLICERCNMLHCGLLPPLGCILFPRHLWTCTYNYWRHRQSGHKMVRKLIIAHFNLHLHYENAIINYWLQEAAYTDFRGSLSITERHHPTDLVRRQQLHGLTAIFSFHSTLTTQALNRVWHRKYTLKFAELKNFYFQGTLMTHKSNTWEFSWKIYHLAYKLSYY
jgi:hypothetical protein